MTSERNGRDGLLGNQSPRYRSVPEFSSTTGPEVLDVCEMSKLVLLPWQADVISDCLGERPDGKWAAQQIGLIVPRQNGKTEILVARMLAGLFLLGEEEIIYSAHRADTSLGIFRRFVKYLKRSKTFGREIKTIRTANGQEGVELHSGQRVGFRTRAQEGGRGFSADCIIFDEAFEISEELQAALLPTLIARPNAQVWYTGTAVDQQVHRNGVVFARVRENGVGGADPGMAYFEWSVDGDLNDLDVGLLDDRTVWAATNPSLGYHASEEMIALNRNSMKRRKFATECLCIGDWPQTDEDALHVINLGLWDACEDQQSQRVGAVCFTFDVTPNQTHAAIGVCADRDDGVPHIEIIEHKRGTAWVAERIAELKVAHRPHMIACDASGPAGSILTDVESKVGEVYKITASEHAAAFGMICSAVEDCRLRHLGTSDMRAALEGATTRPMGDGGLAWSRKNSDVDISPLVAVTIALWANSRKPKPVTPRVVSLVDALAAAGS